MKDNNLFNRLVQAFRPNTKNADRELGKSLNLQGIYSDLYNNYKRNDYENAYPSISKIANAFMLIEPYTIDGNGKPVASNVLDRFYSPNKQMSAAEWRESLAVMTAVHSKVYIRVHHRGKRLLADSITGFTILEDVYEYTVDGKPNYMLTDGSRLTSNEVFVLKGINPYGLSKGFSPLDSARKWVRVDDLIACMQAGFFENGAVPSGQFIITAPTEREYNDIVDNLQKKHRGAGKNNNVVYTYQPIDPNNGKPSQAVITWVPFNTTNKDLALKDLFDQVNQKIDSAFGVPASIRGVNDKNTYASVRVDEVIFMKYVIDPIATRLYSKLTHELNRMTGGTGVAFDYDIEIPQVADEEKVKSEAKRTDLDIIRSGIETGFTLDSIVTAFELPNSYKLLKTTGTTKIDNDQPQVITQGELRDTPDQPQEPIGEIVVGGGKGTNPKAKTEVTDEGKLYAVAKKYMQSQIDRATSQLLPEVKSVVDSNPSEEEIADFVKAMMAIIVGILLANGNDGYSAGVALAGLTLEEMQGFTLTADAKSAYEVYLRDVANSYGHDTAESIRKTLLNAHDNGFTHKETRDALDNILNTDDYRAKRLARTEMNNSANIGKLEGMKELSTQTGLEFEKTLQHEGITECKLCASLEGVWASLGQPSWAYGEIITASDGTIYINDWRNIDAGGLHPNCRGTTIYRKREV